MRPILLRTLLPNTSDIIENWILDQMPPYANGAVIGISGGVDSAVVAALTARAFHKHNQGIQRSKCKHSSWEYTLYPYSLPTHVSPEDDASFTKRVVDHIFYRCGATAPLATINLDDAIKAVENSLDDAIKAVENSLPLLSAYDRGNMISRVRAAYLWTLAGRTRVVMGTGNEDEDHRLGYYTLTGDGLVHMNPIGFLPKRLVRSMAKRLELNMVADRPPTAGLEVGQTDEGDLGYKYEFVELVGDGLAQGFTISELAQHPQLHEAGLIVAERWGEGGVKAALFDVMNRHAIAKKKAQLVQPHVPKFVLPTVLPY